MALWHHLVSITRRTMSRLFPFVLFVLASVGAVAQESYVVGLNVGVATFKMDDLTYYQEVWADFNVPRTKVVQSFPPYLNYGADFSLQGKVITKVKFGHTSTAGRASYSDYSGTLTNDIKVGMTYWGVSAGAKLFSIKEVDIILEGGILFYSTSTVTTYNEQVYDTDGVEGYDVTFTTKYKSLNKALYPGITLQRKFSNYFARLQASYEFHFNQPSYGNGGYLMDADGRKILVDASGTRIGVGIGYSL